jgi:UDP-N-acetylglucosamine 2-epimerase (non-hydrolysing)
MHRPFNPPTVTSRDILIDVIAGARPNFVKIAPILRSLTERRREGGALAHRLVHTGQHYDRRMSGDFFEQLGIEKPHVNLEVGSGTQAEQTAAIMTRYERLLLSSRADLCLVVGDVTSTMACAIAAQKLCVPVAHVEGGIRSDDWTMPEEINRLVTDAITNYFFTTSEFANDNLRRSGVSPDRIFFVGNTMIDSLLANMDRLRRPALYDELGLNVGGYLILTLHRPANVDFVDKLEQLLETICGAAGELPVILPVHPRTRRTLDQIRLLPRTLLTIDSQPYLEFNYLVKNAKGVLTDSGGVTEETTVMGVPCVTLRDTTERPETVTIGTNELCGTDPSRIADHVRRLVRGEWKRGGIPPLWDGRAAERIVTELQRLFANTVPAIV